MLRLFVHPDADADLEELWDSDEEAAARIQILLEQIEGDPDLLDRLTQRDFGAYGTAEFHIDHWVEQYRKGNDLWRLKIWDLEDRKLKYRIIYAFMPREEHHHVLGIAPRSFDYDADHPISRRIFAAYRELCD